MGKTRRQGARKEGRRGSRGKDGLAEYTGAVKPPISGKPDTANVSTSYSERSNLTIGMHNHRFTRLSGCPKPCPHRVRAA